MKDNPKLMAFINEQVELMKNPSRAKAKPAHKMLMNATSNSEPIDEFEYIITKKPGKKRVEKYLQGLIDAIVAENDN